MSKGIVVFFAVALQLPVAWAAGPCLTDLSNIPDELELANLRTQWEETKASDKLPLIITLKPRGNQILATFEKTGQGKWAEGLAEICKVRQGYVMNMSRVVVGAAAPWAVRYKLSTGEASFPMTFAADHKTMSVSISGWASEFKPK